MSPLFLREVSEPAVKISNIPSDTTREELEAFSGRLEYVSLDFTPGQDSATVVLGTPKQARIAKQYYHNMEFGDNVLAAEVQQLGDVGFVVSTTGADTSSVTPGAIAAALKGLPVQPKSLSFQTQSTAEVGFFSVDEVIHCNSSRSKLHVVLVICDCGLDDFLLPVLTMNNGIIE